MNAEDFNEFLWDGHCFVHKPRGRICNWWVTPMYCESLRTVLLVAALHQKECP